MSKKIEFIHVVGLQSAAGDSFSIIRNKHYMLEKDLAMNLISGGIAREVDERSIDASVKDAKIEELTQENLTLKAKIDSVIDSEVRIAELSQTITDLEVTIKKLNEDLAK